VDPRFQLGLEAYGQGLHYEAHEFWEEIWLDEENDVRRSLLQALIQMTSAIHKVQNHVARPGSITLLSRALDRLQTVPDEYEGVDIAALREAIVRCRTEVERLVSEGDDVLDPRFIPSIRAP